jgi:hypothetical protein
VRGLAEAGLQRMSFTVPGASPSVKKEAEQFRDRELLSMRAPARAEAAAGPSQKLE